MITLTSLLQHLTIIAQAGGGGSFGGGGQAGGGGGFGGGGDGGGGGGGFLIEFVIRLLIYLIRLAIEVPIVGVPLLILISLGVFWMWKEGTFEVKKRKIRKFRGKRRNILSAQSSKILKATDPEFDETAFLRRVKKAFLKAQERWCAQDIAPLNLFVSDGIHERFSLQIEEQKLEGWHQGMEGTEIRSARIADVDVGDQFDRVTVRISFKADIHRLKLDSGKKIRGSTLPRSSFAEAWTFLRGHGTKTLNSDGLMEGYCPNCGAELVMQQSARCEHCDCHAKSGQFDWVLAEITQWSEWSPESAESVPGLGSYQALDPGWHPQVMEDIASVVFWRKVAADRRGSTDILCGHTTEEFLEKYAAQLKTPAKGHDRRYMIDCAVGSVRTVGLLSGPERDRAVIEVIWDGRRTTEAHDGKLKTKDSRTRRCKYFVFSRGAGTKTDRSTAFSTAHCRECGAHDDGSGEPDCRYCGAPRFGDSSLWLLEDLVGRGSQTGLSLFEELAALRAEETPKHGLKPRSTSAMNLLRWAVAMVHADGEVKSAERSRIHAMAAHAGLSVDEASELLEVRPREDEFSLPEDDATARVWVKELIKLSMEDGLVSRKELRFLQRTARTLGIPAHEYKGVLRSVHNDLYRHSVDAHRRYGKQEKRDKKRRSRRSSK